MPNLQNHPSAWGTWTHMYYTYAVTNSIQFPQQ